MNREQLDEIVAGDRAGYRARGCAHVDAMLEKLERRVRVEARARAELTAPCGRCLTPISIDVPFDFELTLVPADERSRAPEEEDDSSRPARGSFAPEEAEEETYAGKVIDLEPIVREQILLALPGYPVCKDDCKGLCTVCGGDLNERECGCDRRVPDPRFARLKDLKLQ